MQMMRSRIFECRVMHHRFSPRRHRFVYRVFMLALDLDELPMIARRLRLLAIDRAGFFSIHERDHLPVGATPHNASQPAAVPVPTPDDGRNPLKARVTAFLRARGELEAVDRVELVTMPRIAGYRFNPVSFYFCFDHDGRPVAVIAEVTNTFGEVKPYVLGRDCWRDGAFRLRVPKHFYVSPFSDVDVAFDFRIASPDDRLRIQIDDYVGAECTLASALTGEARALRDRTLAWFACKYPLLSLRVIALIHWHALLLLAKRVPWFRKGARAADQRDLYHPHPSLATGPASRP